MSQLSSEARGLWDIPFSQLQLRRRVGQGAFGAVRLLPHRPACTHAFSPACLQRCQASPPCMVHSSWAFAPLHMQVYLAEWHQTACAVKVLLSRSALSSEVRRVSAGQCPRLTGQ